MAKVDLSAEAVEDLKHLTSFWLEKNPRWARATKQLILEALEVLARHPLMGRRRSARIRELVISRGATGYVASYALHLRTGDVVVLRIRHQRQRLR